MAQNRKSIPNSLHHRCRQRQYYQPQCRHQPVQQHLRQYQVRCADNANRLRQLLLHPGNNNGQGEATLGRAGGEQSIPKGGWIVKSIPPSAAPCMRRDTPRSLARTNPSRSQHRYLGQLRQCDQRLLLITLIRSMKRAPNHIIRPRFAHALRGVHLQPQWRSSHGKDSRRHPTFAPYGLQRGRHRRDLATVWETSPRLSQLPVILQGYRLSSMATL